MRWRERNFGLASFGLLLFLILGCGGRRFSDHGGDGGPSGPAVRHRNLCLQYGAGGPRYCARDCNNAERACPADLNGVCISGSDLVEGSEVEVFQCISASNPPCPAEDVDAPFCVPCTSHAECIGADCEGVGFCDGGCDPDEDFVCCGAGDTCCTDLLFDEANCGACGRACDAGEFCFGGVCNTVGG